jgi:hypothetical protein
MARKEMDRQTFDKMWAMAHADETERLFLCLPQEEYYVEPRTKESILSFYPSVRLFPLLVTLNRF